jgi:glutaredoxin
MRNVFFGLLLFLVVGCEAKMDWSLHTSSQGKLKFEDLKPSEQMTLFRRYFNFEEEVRRTSERYLIDEYYVIKAKEEGVSVEEYRQRFSGAQEVSEEQLLAFYEQNKERIPYPYEQIKEELKQHLQIDAKLNLHDTMMAEARKLLKYESHFAWMPAPRFNIDVTAFPKKGDGKIHIIEFADFLCPHCKRVYEFLEGVDSSKYQLSYIPNFPKSRVESQRLAEISLCAGERFWDVYKMFFSAQDATQAEEEALALIGKTYEECQIDPEVRKKVSQGVELAETYGVSATPTIFVNGRYLARGLEDLRQVLAQ